MAENPTFEQTWRDYQAAVRRLYSAPFGASAPSGAGAPVERGEAQLAAGPAEAGGAEIVQAAAAVRGALAPAIASENLAEREMAGLKLLAAAAHDMALAGDLLDLEAAGPGAEAERGLRNIAAGVEDLQWVLEAPLGAPPEALMGLERSALPGDIPTARVALVAAVTDLLRAAPQNTAETSQSAAVELSSIGLGPVRSAASLAIDAMLDKLPSDVRPLQRRAAELVVEAVEKIRAVIGKENEKQIREAASEWVEDFKQDRGFVATLLDKLYETEAIGAEVMKRIEEAPEAVQAAAYNAATQSVGTLQATSENTRKTLSAVIKVMALVKVPVLSAVPWGPLAICAAYLGLLGLRGLLHRGSARLAAHRPGRLAGPG